MSGIRPPIGIRGVVKGDGILVRTTDLQAGCVLRHPIFDTQGLLLLAAGVELSERFIEGLRRRGVEAVQVHPDDLSGRGVRPRAVPRLVGAPSRNDTRTVEQRRKPLCQPYEQARSIRLERNFAAASDAIQRMAQALLTGKAASSEILMAAADAYVDELLDDPHHTIAAALEHRTNIQLSERSVQLSVLAMSISLELGWPRQDMLAVGLAGMVHDWGLLRLPVEIRLPTQPLNHHDWELYCTHPLITERMLDQVQDATPTLKLVAGQVHEQIDGSGYPRGITLERIHPHSRVLNLADAYLALTNPLAGRPSIVAYDAMAMLLHHVSLGRFDATVMRGLLQAVSLFPLGSWVELSDLTPARVLRSTHEHYDRPIVEVLDSGSIQIIDLTRSDRFVTRPLIDPNFNQIRVSAGTSPGPLWNPISNAA